MKALKIVGIVVGVFILILAIVISMQPSEARIEKSIVINAPAAAIFPQVSNLHNFAKWNPFSKSDPDIVQSFEGSPGTVGSKMNWDGPKVGTGSQWIVEIEENKKVKSGLQFGSFDSKYESQFIMEPEGDKTKVIWTYSGPNDGISGKAMWVFLRPLLGGQYDQGLRDLKSLVESTK